MNEFAVKAQDRLDEDLAGNLARVSAIAKRCCKGCADYHVTFAARRLVAQQAPIENDRDVVSAMVAQFVAGRPTASDPLEVLVAGAADSGLLAVTARGVWAADPGGARDVSYRVVDRCGTPLELCTSYADRAGLALDTATLDITTTKQRFEADLITMHSLLRHLEQHDHRPVLARLANWLRPGGAILYSTSIGEVASHDREWRRQQLLDQMRLAIAEGQQLSESTEDFLDRLHRRAKLVPHISSHRSGTELRELAEAAGLRVLRQREVPYERNGRRKLRIVTLMGRNH